MPGVVHLPDRVTLGHAGSRGVSGGPLSSGSPWSRYHSQKAWSLCVCGCVWWGWSFGWTPCHTPGTCVVSHLLKSLKHNTSLISFNKTTKKNNNQKTKAYTHKFKHFCFMDLFRLRKDPEKTTPKRPQTRLELKSLFQIHTEQRFACNPDFHGFTGSNTACRERGSFHRGPSKAG